MIQAQPAHRVRLAPAVASISLAAAGAFADTTVFFRPGQTADLNGVTLAVDRPAIIGLDPAGRAVAKADLSTPGSTSTTPGLVVSDGSSVRILCTAESLNPVFGPPAHNSTVHFFEIMLGAGGHIFVRLSGNLAGVYANPLIVFPPSGPPRLVACGSPPSPAVLDAGGVWPIPGGGSRYLIHSGNLWAGDAASTAVPTQILSLGAPAPGMSGFTLNDFRTAKVAASGNYAFIATVRLDSGILQDALYSGAGGDASLVLRKGDAAPGLPGRTVTGIPGDSGSTRLSINDAGELTLHIGTSGGNVIYTGQPSELQPLLAVGDSTIPGITGRINSLNFAESPGGQRAFLLGVNTTGATTGVTSTVVLRGPLSSPTIIARTGDGAPGYPPGSRIAHPTSVFVNDDGAVVLMSSFNTPGSSAHKYAVFGYSSGPTLMHVIGPGDSVTLGPGDVRTVDRIVDPGVVPPAAYIGAGGVVPTGVVFTDETRAFIGVTLPAVAPPAPFALQAPVAGSVYTPPAPTLSWAPSPNAQSYSVSITPRGAPTTTIATPATTVAVPPGLLPACTPVAWGVTAINAGGTTPSTPINQTFSTGGPGCVLPPAYSVTRAGYGSGAQIARVGAGGHVLGWTLRAAGTGLTNQDAWISDGESTRLTGLFGTPYEAGAQRGATPVGVNASGRAVGHSLRFRNIYLAAGTDAWYDDGVSARLVGLTGGVYDRATTTPPSRNNTALAISDCGWAIGRAARWTPNGASTLGYDGWLYDGASTRPIGPAQEAGMPGYDWTSNGNVTRHSWPEAISSDGAVVGTARVYNAAGVVRATDSWIRRPDGSYVILALTGAGFESAAGSHGTSAVAMNDAGQVAGTVSRYDGSTYLGPAAFRWSAAQGFRIIDPDDDLHSKAVVGAGRSRSPTVNAITPAGHVIGRSVRYRADGTDIGYDIWHFDGTATRIVNLDGPQFGGGNPPDARGSGFSAFSAAGLVAGWTLEPTLNLHHAWIFDPAAPVPPPAPPSVPLTTVEGLQVEFASFGGADVGVGWSLTPLEPFCSICGPSYSSRAMAWSPRDGVRDLDTLVAGGLVANGWAGLTAASGAGGPTTPSGWPSFIAGRGGAYTGNTGLFYLRAVAPPGSFWAVPAPASVGSTTPTLRWQPAPGAEWYTVTLAPEGGTPISANVTSPAFTVPAGTLADCARATWSVTASSAGGTTLPDVDGGLIRVLRADFRRDGTVDLLDIFAFLTAWFGGDASADFNGRDGVDLIDIFSFLDAWFRACP